MEVAAGAPRDKRRFRANIYIEDIEPWASFPAWLGRHIRIGETVMEVQEAIDRCAATSVNPDTAERDANPVKELQEHFGHIELGVFAAVVQGGTIRPGMRSSRLVKGESGRFLKKAAQKLLVTLGLRR